MDWEKVITYVLEQGPTVAVLLFVLWRLEMRHNTLLSSIDKMLSECWEYVLRNRLS